MSGGALDYLYARLEHYKGDVESFLSNEDEELKRFVLGVFNDIINFLHALEWWMSADIGRDEFLKRVKDLKITTKFKGGKHGS